MTVMELFEKLADVPLDMEVMVSEGQDWMAASSVEIYESSDQRPGPAKVLISA